MDHIVFHNKESDRFYLASRMLAVINKEDKDYNKVKAFVKNFYLNSFVKCTLEICRAKNPEYASLEKAAKHYLGEEHKHIHDALRDAYMTYRLYVYVSLPHLFNLSKLNE